MVKSAPAPDSIPAENTIVATLVRGNFYALLGTPYVWDREKGALAQRVDPETAEYLRRTAVDVVGHIDDEGTPLPIIKPKFSFSTEERA